MNKVSLISLILISVLSLLLLTGCHRSRKDNLTPMEYARQQTTIIMDSVLKNDVDTIEDMFSQYIKDTHPKLRDEISELINFVEGEIISYDKPDGSYGGGARTVEGKSRELLTGAVANIKTDTGKTYKLRAEYYSINKNYPESVGINALAIVCEDTFDQEYGYPKDGIYYIYPDRSFNN